MLGLDLLPDTMVTEESLDGTWCPASMLDLQDMYLKESGITINEDGTIQRAEENHLPNNIESAPSNNLNDVNEKELSKFNWGAFWFTWLWGVCNGVYWPLAVLLLGIIPYIRTFVGIGLSIYLGIKGSRLAWESNKKWASFAAFKETQRKWSKAVLWVLGISIILAIILTIAEAS